MEQTTKQNLKKGFFALIAILAILMLSLYFEGKNILNEGQNKPYEDISQEVIYQNITKDELKELIKNKDVQNFILINVDDDSVKDKSVIPKTDIFLPYTEVVRNKNRLPENKNVKIVIYSTDGKMSKIATTKMVMLGYSNVLHLKGGSKNWENK